MDDSAAPLLDALADYHARDRYGFTPPGHRQGRGADPRAILLPLPPRHRTAPVRISRPSPASATGGVTR